MMALATTSIKPHKSVNTSHFDNMYTVMESDISKVVDYYKVTPLIINNDDIFVRIVMGLSKYVTRDLELSLKLVERASLGVARALGVTTHTKRGITYNNQIGDRLLLINAAIVDPFEASISLDAEVVRVLYTDSTDLTMDHPKNIVRGDYIVMIDIVGVMAQYHHWMDKHKYFDLSESDNIPKFVSLVIYSNMIESILRFNILNGYFFYTKRKIKHNHPFEILDVSVRFNAAMHKLRNNIGKNKSLSYHQFLNSIPLPFGGNAYDVLKYPTMLINRNNEGVLVLAMARLVFSVVVELGIEGVLVNGEVCSRLSIDIKAFLNSRASDELLWSDMINYVNGINEELK